VKKIKAESCENAIDRETLSTVRVLDFGAIRAIIQKAEEEVACPPDTTAYELLRTLADNHGEIFQGEIFAADGESLREDLTVTVNEAVVRHAIINETILKSSDVIALLPIFPGGG